MDLQKFGVDIYLIQVIFGAVDFPAKVIAVVCMSKIGRRPSQCATLILAGVTILVNLAVPYGTVSFGRPSADLSLLTLCITSVVPWFSSLSPVQKCSSCGPAWRFWAKAAWLPPSTAATCTLENFIPRSSGRPVYAHDAPQIIRSIQILVKILTCLIDFLLIWPDIQKINR